MKKYITAVFITLLFAIILISQIDINQIFIIIRNIPAKYVLIAGIFYFLQNVIRAIRFRFLLKDSAPGLFVTFSIVNMHSFLNHILPARIGESSYLIMMNRYCKVKMMLCIASLFSARIMDLICICFIFIFSIVIIQTGGNSFSNISFYLIAAPIIIVIILIAVLLYLGKIVKALSEFAAAIIKRFSFGTKYASWILEKGTELKDNLEIVNDLVIIAKSGIATIAIWISNIAVFDYLMKGFGHPMQILKIALGATGAALTNVLPINGFGSFGTLEAGWTISFMWVGLNKETAISTGFGVHIIIFIFAVILALITVVLLWAKFLKP